MPVLAVLQADLEDDQRLLASLVVVLEPRLCQGIVIEVDVAWCPQPDGHAPCCPLLPCQLLLQILQGLRLQILRLYVHFCAQSDNLHLELPRLYVVDSSVEVLGILAPLAFAPRRLRASFEV